jgi:DNA-binding XRE family transcriptional regulator
MSTHPVKIRRVVLGMTQDQLAEAAGISRYTITRIETRTEWVSYDVAVAVARALDMWPVDAGV